MRSSETVAVTITLPKALNDAVKIKADRDECGNVSAVIRKALYRESGIEGALVVKEEGTRSIKLAEERTVKYSRRRAARPKGRSNSKATSGGTELLEKASAGVPLSPPPTPKAKR